MTADHVISFILRVKLTGNLAEVLSRSLRMVRLTSLTAQLVRMSAHAHHVLEAVLSRSVALSSQEFSECTRLRTII